MNAGEATGGSAKGAMGRITGIAGASVGIGRTTGLSPTAQATYVGFDFTNVWTIVEGVSRPTLRVFGP